MWRFLVEIGCVCGKVVNFTQIGALTSCDSMYCGGFVVFSKMEGRVIAWKDLKICRINTVSKCERYSV